MPRRKIKRVTLCDFREPPGDKECLEAIWSQGRACKRCSVTCYRQGWSHDLATADNKRRVAERRTTKGGSE